MADKPILFSAPMIRALISGRKTQTRRVLKRQPEKNEAGLWVFRHKRGFVQCGYPFDNLMMPVIDAAAPGDRLWVREAWRGCAQMDGVKPSEMSAHEPIRYEADGALREDACAMIQPGRLRSSLHMPRAFSRLTLTVTNVRVERLQDISTTDARAEGCSNAFRVPYVCDFAKLWKSINGPGAWAENPWVAAYSFTVHLVNIDLKGEANA